MKPLLFCIIALEALLSSCSPTSSDISGSPTPNDRIYITGGAQVTTPSGAGKATYSVYCSLQYTDTSMSTSDFNSAEVTVNGTTLPRVYRDGYFQNTAMSFSQGDSLVFVVKHKKTGTIRGVVYVPESVTGVTVSPGLSQANTTNSATTFNLSWSPVTAGYYVVVAAGYNYWETVMEADSIFSTYANTATVVLKDSSGSACPYVYFRVQSFNYTPVDGFAAGSGFAVSGAYYRGNTNMPGISINALAMPHPAR